MNFTTQLSIKRALRFALPCLASCLLLAACSNEGSEMNPDNVNPAAPGSIRFTASAPLASETKTTRIGIDSANKPDVTNENDWDRDEPVIWLEGDAVSVFFVSTADGSTIHAKFVVDDESISNNGKSAELVSDSEFNPSALDGEYTIYAFSPYASTNTLNNMTLDLSSQTQAVNADATNYSHLGKTAYMRANAGNTSFNNGALTGDEVNLAFDHITSFIRFHIKNGLGKDINVTGISLNHTFMNEKSEYSVEAGFLTSNSYNATINLSFSGSGHLLSNNAEFDAYMSTFPVNTDGSSNNLSLTVNYIVESTPYTSTHRIPHNDLADVSDTDILFPKSTRLLFEIPLKPSDYMDELIYNGTVYVPIKWGNFLISPAGFLCDQVPSVLVKGNPYCAWTELPEDACPGAWSEMTTNTIRNLGISDIYAFLHAVGLSPGFVIVPGNGLYLEEAYLTSRWLSSENMWQFQGVTAKPGAIAGSASRNPESYYFDIRCIRAL
jgi:hypothetical protein